jgi:hypothetical protein
VFEGTAVPVRLSVCVSVCVCLCTRLPPASRSALSRLLTPPSSCASSPLLTSTPEARTYMYFLVCVFTCAHTYTSSRLSRARGTGGQASALNGMVLVKRDKHSVYLLEPGHHQQQQQHHHHHHHHQHHQHHHHQQQQCYQTLAVLPFTSERRRSSVIVKTPKGEYVLYCKGADMVMLPLCAGGGLSGSILHTTTDHMEEFSRAGLRTLIVASRVLSESECHQFLQAHSAANQV